MLLADVQMAFMKILTNYVLNVMEIVLHAAHLGQVLVILVMQMQQKQKLELGLVVVIQDIMKIQVMSVKSAIPLVLNALDQE
jgi:hypothetical protein